IQIPYSLDELVATGQFLKRRHRAGKPVLKIFFMGDTDEGATDRSADEFARSPVTVIKDMVGGGVSLTWSLLGVIAVGIWLMLTRLTLGNDAELANWEHLIGALIITVGVCAMAEVARPVRYLLIPLALFLLPLPFILDADMWGIASNL